nr:hypothetical protein [uncultured bacterium]
MTVDWCYGNAAEDTRDTRGWLLGGFLDPAEGVRHSKDVEVKWATYRAGTVRPEWTVDDRRTTLVVLVRGTFRVDLTVGSRVLAEQGDYVLWGPGIDHSYEALTDAVVMAVRWPPAT